MPLKPDTLYVLSRLLDGQYPKYNQLIPTDNTLAITANRKALIESLERVAVMANDRTNVVKMTVDNTQLSLVANTPDVGDSQDSMEVVFNGTEPRTLPLTTATFWTPSRSSTPKMSASK